MSETMYLGVASAAVGVVWLAVVVTRWPKVALSKVGVGALSLALSAGSVLAAPLLASRHFTMLGVVLTESPPANFAARIMSYAGVAAALGSLLIRSDKSEVGVNQFAVAALYVVGGATVMGGYLLGEDAVFEVRPLFLAITVHAVAAALVDNPRVMMSALRCVARAVTGVSVVTAVFASGWAFMPGTSRALGLDRLSGVMPHPNSLAMVAAVALFLEFVPPRHRRSSTVGIVLAVTCMLLAQSTTGWLVLAVLCIIFVVGRAGRHRVTVSLMMLGGLALLQTSIDAVSVLAGSVGTDRLESVSGRTIIWQFAWEAYRQHPIFGLGAEFLSEHYRSINLPNYEQQAVHAHNQFFQTMGESGTVGLIALGILLIAVIRSAWQARADDNYARLGGLVVLMIFAMTEVPLRGAGVNGLVPLLLLPVLFTDVMPTTRDRKEPVERDTDIGQRAQP